MLTMGIAQRVFQLQFNKVAGSAFTIDIDGRQYLVTAKHILQDEQSPAQISLWHNKQWRDYQTRLVGIAPGEIDIAVLAVSEQLSPQFKFVPTSIGLSAGHEVFFLGFPYCLRCDAAHANRGFPLPLIKRATLSAYDAFQDDSRLHILDGINNPGFSGGPVVFHQPFLTGRPGDLVLLDYKVAAVVSGFRAARGDVLENDQRTPYEYEFNTGLILAYDIVHAKRLIDANPIGFQLPPKIVEEMEPEDYVVPPNGE